MGALRQSISSKNEPRLPGLDAAPVVMPDRDTAPVDTAPVVEASEDDTSAYCSCSSGSTGSLL